MKHEDYFALESSMYLGMDIAEEGIIFDDVDTDKIELLKKNYPLMVYSSEYSISYKSLEAQLLKFARKYKFKGCTILHLYPILTALEQKEMPEFISDPEVNQIVTDAVLAVKKGKSKYPYYDVDTLFKLLTTKFIDYTKKSGYMVVINCQAYNRSMIHWDHLPKLFFMESGLKSAYHNMKLTAQNQKTFKNIFGNKVPTRLKKDPNKMNKRNMKLYHISTDAKLEVLEPRITSKPMDMENVRVARISASDSIYGCLQAVPVVNRTFYIYQLELTKDSKVVHPDKRLVPDAQVTNEHWVLTPTKVRKIGKIVVKSKVLKPNAIRCKENEYMFVSRDGLGKVTNDKYNGYNDIFNLGTNAYGLLIYHLYTVKLPDSGGQDEVVIPEGTPCEPTAIVSFTKYTKPNYVNYIKIMMD